MSDIIANVEETTGPNVPSNNTQSSNNETTNITTTTVTTSTNTTVITLPLTNTKTNADKSNAEQDFPNFCCEKTSSILSKPSIMCRICHTNEENERLISPCTCRGSLGFVHQTCLEYWLSRSGLLHCELCLFHFRTENYLRYGLWESIRIWFNHPSNRAILQSDILLCSLLTIITFGLVVVCMFGMYYLTASAASQNIHLGISRYWTETSIGVFLGIVIFAFILNAIVVVKSNVVPWFRWWRHSREIQLVLRNSPEQII